MAVARSSSSGVAMLSTSGFVDDVTFLVNGLYGVFQHREQSLMSVNAFLELSWSTNEDCGAGGLRLSDTTSATQVTRWLLAAR